MEITLGQAIQCYQALGEIQGCPPAKLGMQIGRNRRQLRYEVDVYREQVKAKILALGGERTPNGARLPRAPENATETEKQAALEAMIALDDYDTELRAQTVDVDLRIMKESDFIEADERGTGFPPAVFEYCSFVIEG